MTNPFEYDTSEPEDTSRYLCACGDTNCWCVYGDPTNALVRGKWYAEDCAPQTVVMSPLAVLLLQELPKLRRAMGLPKEQR